MRCFLALLGFLSPLIYAADLDSPFDIETLTDSLDSPWSISLLNDDSALITEKPGRLLRISLTDGRSEEIAGVPRVLYSGQAGLLGSVLHPQFASNHWLYLSFVKPLSDGKSTTAVMRYRLDGNHLSEGQEIFVAVIDSDDRGHFGSRLLFDEDGHLFVTLGDRHNRSAVQSVNAHNGKLIRLNDDGSIPADNPFAHSNSIAKPIYSLGHRNVQGLALRANGQIWNSEHGPRGGDEINLIRAGANYGWAVITYGKEYVGGSIGEGTVKQGMEQPAHYYVPSIATSDMVFYSGAEFAEWNDQILLTSLAGRHLNRLVLEGDKIVAEHRYLEDFGARLRDIAIDSRGRILLITDEGKLLRLSKPRGG